ncbi:MULTISPECIES: type IV secretion system protein [Burkholderia]|jgi:type IV secretion system protein VirB6|uniref:Conjugal transfer protein TraH n=1 Tax=Burkholderia ubonensis TaxID=101571 RepID=A0A1B4LI97_9BURK|nr:MULTISPECIES: type IV secretion system protein [Burkholderia cepacia complex]AJY09069.1 trbL/VirB6 plasmid conjugal transfer family protein [Burkholderia vietnamiensis LMG 10929]AOJ76845.1 conjugal transfer protein TraH [Burkholderia ubonensis]AOK02430.1 conjugal transfer protein TraH [Burkholderia vietnamiensis]AOK13942.1 conjugal transfer protein TraH [Burkholderia vietnamiensis]AVR14575.1 conjugal transfer protein TraH [Burkholderia vietnamiensis]
MSGLFAALGGTLDDGMSTYVTTVSSALSGALVPVVTTGITIWVLAFGLAVVRGEAHEAVPAFAWRGLKVSITLAFALSAGIYQQQVVTAVNGATAGLAQTIQNAANTTGGGNPGCGSANGGSVTGQSAASSIYQTLDCYDQQVDLVMDAYFNKATHEGISPSGLAAAIGDFLCGLVAALGGSIFLIVLVFEVVMARTLLDLVLGLGPIFIACAAFAPTARFFEAWTAKVANYALLQVLVAAFLGMALTAFSTDLTAFHATGRAPGADSSALMQAVSAALDDAAAAAAALGLFATGVFLAMIGWQLPAVAAGLSGGATLSGFGAFVAGIASRSLVAAIGRAFNRNGRGPTSGGEIRDRTGSAGRSRSGGGGPPAYQRAARANLGQHDG